MAEEQKDVAGTGSLTGESLEVEDVLAGAEPWEPVETKMVVEVCPSSCSKGWKLLPLAAWRVQALFPRLFRGGNRGNAGNAGGTDTVTRGDRGHLIRGLKKGLSLCDRDFIAQPAGL